MSDEEPQFTSLKDRIAALRLKDDNKPIAPGLKPGGTPPKPPVVRPKPAPPVATKPTAPTATKPTAPTATATTKPAVPTAPKPAVPTASKPTASKPSLDPKPDFAPGPKPRKGVRTWPPPAADRDNEDHAEEPGDVEKEEPEAKEKPAPVRRFAPPRPAEPDAEKPSVRRFTPPKPGPVGGRRVWPPPAQESDAEDAAEHEVTPDPPAAGEAESGAREESPARRAPPPKPKPAGGRRVWPPPAQGSDAEEAEQATSQPPVDHESEPEEEKPVRRAPPPRPKHVGGRRVWPPPAHDSDAEDTAKHHTTTEPPASHDGEHDEEDPVARRAPPPKPKPTGGRRVWPPPAQEESDTEEGAGHVDEAHGPPGEHGAEPELPQATAKPTAPPKPFGRPAWPPKPQVEEQEAAPKFGRRAWPPTAPAAAEVVEDAAETPASGRAPPKPPVASKPKPSRVVGGIGVRVWPPPAQAESDEEAHAESDEPEGRAPSPAARWAPPKPQLRPGWPPKPSQDEQEEAPRPTARRAWPPPAQADDDEEEDVTETAAPAAPPPVPAARPPPPPRRASSFAATDEDAESTPARPLPPPRRTSSYAAPDEDAEAEAPARPPLPQRRSSTAQSAPSLPPRKDAPPLPRRQPSHPSLPRRQSSHTSIRSHAGAKTPPVTNRRLPPPAPELAPSETGHSATSGDEGAKRPPPIPAAPRPLVPTARRPIIRRKSSSKDKEDEPKEPRPRFMVPLPPGGFEKPPHLSPQPTADGLPPPPPIASRPSGTPPDSSRSGSGPPPIPVSSRPPPVPTSSRPKAAPSNGYSYVPHAPKVVPSSPSCLICRDFSAADAVAAQYPTSAIPTPRIPYLANVLCSPFPSLTDKARAIFTWLHHNLIYDVPNFLAGTVPRGLDAEATIARGAAVCEGFADVFLAICQHAGLDCRRIGGFGKGYGFSPDNAMASFDANHAWNVVRLEGGWTLIDSCWGAGHIDNGVWVTQFNPSMFTMGNKAFGARHFPENEADWYGPARGWEEFLMEGEGGPTRYSTSDTIALALGQDSVAPWTDTLRRGQNYHFEVRYMCPHWTSQPGFSKKMICLVVNGRLIRPHDDGQTITAQAVAEGDEVTFSVIDKVNGQEAGDMTWDEFDRITSRGAYDYGMQHLYLWRVE